MVEFAALKKELDAGKKRNVYVFTGEEREVMRKYVRRVGDAKRAQSFSEIVPKLTSRGLFQMTSVYVIEDDKSVLDMSFKEVVRLIGNNIVIFVFGSIDGRKAFFKDAKDSIVEFKKFTDQQLINTVYKNLSPLEASDRLCQIIARYCGNDVSRIENECNKLVCLGEEITLELINEIIAPTVEDQIFALIDAMAKRDTKRAYELYADMRSLGESPVKIISLLYTKFKQVLLVQTMFSYSNAELAGKTGMNFYQIGFTRELVGRFSPEHIVDLLHEIQKGEVAIKTGQMDADVCMDYLMVTILK